MALLAISLALVTGPTLSLGADVPHGPPTMAPVRPIAVESGWSFRFAPYAWLTGLNGTQTVRGRSVDVDASFIDLIDKSDSIFALMGRVEARNGPFSLFGDLVYSKLTASRGATRVRAVAPGIGAGLGTSLGINFQMTTLELGATYEVARWSGGGGSHTSFDVMAGGRFWWQSVDVDLALAGTLDIGDLTVSGARATARSGNVNWVDPFIGARLRHQITPGHEVAFSADVGGFSVGSQFSWQLIGAYSWEFSRSESVTWAGIAGYRMLSVDYSKGAGRTRYEYDMVQHGPILGVNIRF